MGSWNNRLADLIARHACPAVSLLIFTVLAVAVSTGLTDKIDARVRCEIQLWANPPLTSFAFGLSFLGSTALLSVLTAMVCMLLALSGRRISALLLLIVFGIAVFTNNLVKLAFGRMRPEVLFGVAPLSYSFPSGHALLSACVYGTLAVILSASVGTRWQRAAVWLITCVIILGIGLSRVYLGVHYFTDVAAGFALAGFIVCSAKTVAYRS